MPNQIQKLQYRLEMNSKSKTPETTFHGGIKTLSNHQHQLAIQLYISNINQINSAADIYTD